MESDTVPFARMLSMAAFDRTLMMLDVPLCGITQGESYRTFSKAILQATIRTYCSGGMRRAGALI
jgi:hypothetical protein